jgi:beta-glucosidase-like glycosyl hydrolase
MAAGIPRLGLKPYNWRSNCVHGWTSGPDPWPNGTCWTVFPNPMLMGATFDPVLVLQAGQVTAEEGRALHNVAMALHQGSSPEASGVNCFSPNVNLYRDPRWGRNMEVFSEDTFHLAYMGMQYTRGLQEDPVEHSYIKIAACTKV